MTKYHVREQSAKPKKRLLGVLMILMGVNGPERKAPELKNYFFETGVKSINYRISDSGIHLLAGAGNGRYHAV